MIKDLKKLKEEAIEEVSILSKKLKDKRYSAENHHLMEKRIKELVNRFGITYGNVWDWRKKRG